MFTIETAKLLLLQQHVDHVRSIVPEITEKVTYITKEQLQELCNAGFSISYILDGDGSIFNRSSIGLRLRREHEFRKEQQFEQSLNHLLHHNSISICVEESFALQRA